MVSLRFHYKSLFEVCRCKFILVAVTDLITFGDIITYVGVTLVYIVTPLRFFNSWKAPVVSLTIKVTILKLLSISLCYLCIQRHLNYNNYNNIM